MQLQRVCIAEGFSLQIDTISASPGGLEEPQVGAGREQSPRRSNVRRPWHYAHRTYRLHFIRDMSSASVFQDHGPGVGT